MFTFNKNKDSQAEKEKSSKLLKTKLNTLVTVGTITETQETAMINSSTTFTNKESQN
ncbi:hypothetical protein [Clostridium sp.]|uniref:hypothetical protein n=1 Tax=Clostridium sp. TaxID=1506 RepID=UPI002FDEB2B6